MATANIYFGTVGVAPSTTMSTIVQLAQQFCLLNDFGEQTD